MHRLAIETRHFLLRREKIVKKSVFSFLIPLFLSCAAQQNTDRLTETLLAGEWVAGNGVVVRVARLADNRIGAEIASARGFFSTDLGAGNVLLRNIRPYSGGFVADFIMPGNADPVAVRTRLLDRDTLLFDTGDKRAKGNAMVWKRIAPRDTLSGAGTSAP